jgi:septal ring factor EnvC (AmiA/AmiB activator)
VVTAPCTGRVAFAAPFRSYGRLMIVECGRGYDFVLAGLDRLDAPVGHAVRRGEAVGRMPLGAGKPGLYLELRLDGRPVDPAPFLNAKA